MIGCIIILLVIFFIFVVLISPSFILLLYLGFGFIATNLFVSMDALFFLGFDTPVIMVWIFWGLVIGAAIQGYRELRNIHGRKRIGMLIFITPMLLLTLVSVLKIVTGRMEYPQAALTPPSPPTNMVLIPAGRFQMQSYDFTGRFFGNIYVGAFYIDKYEVTNGQYKKFIDASPQWQKDRILDKYHNGSYLDSWDGNNYPAGKDDYPVTHVSWYAAMAYAQWADKRLPTEAEWEKAARGGLVGLKYPWGNTIDGRKANYSTSSIDSTVPVGRYRKNNYGLYDVSGNVFEWCLDPNAHYRLLGGEITAEVKPISRTETTHLVHNFTEAKDFTERAVRGGCWNSSADSVQVGKRYALAPTFAYGELGFRCVKPIDP